LWLLVGVGVSAGVGGWERMRVRRLMSGWERSERENGIGREVGRMEAMGCLQDGRDGWSRSGVFALSAYSSRQLISSSSNNMA